MQVVSSMGAGGRLDPARVKIAMLSETHSDRLAKVVRQRLKKSGMDDKVVTVFSDEPLRLTSVAETDGAYKRSYYGTISYVPALFGLTIASYIVRDALGCVVLLVLSICGQGVVVGAMLGFAASLYAHIPSVIGYCAAGSLWRCIGAPILGRSARAHPSSGTRHRGLCCLVRTDGVVSCPVAYDLAFIIPGSSQRQRLGVAMLSTTNTGTCRNSKTQLKVAV